MKLLFRRVLAATLAFTLCAGISVWPRAEEAVSLYDLTVNDLPEPVGLDDLTPAFGWKMRSAAVGQKQTAYRIVVRLGERVVWDTGRVESGESVGVIYAGEALQSSCTYDWTVTVWDKDGNAVSASSAFEMGLLGADAFADASFISLDSVGNDTLTNYTIDYDFIIDQTCTGLAFSMQDTENYIMWQIRATDGLIRPHIRSGGAWVAYPGKANGNPVIEAIDVSALLGGVGNNVIGNRYHARIVVDGSRVDTYLGASEDSLSLAGTYVHNAVIPLRQIGFRHASGEIARYDNLTVKSGEQVLYANDFSASTDFLSDRSAIENGMLRVGGSGECVLMQQAPNINCLPAFRKSVTPRADLVSAKLYTAGLGVYESYLNGERVGRRYADGTVTYDELKPGFTQRNKRQFYNAYDVTWMLRPGEENVLAAVVTDGWWRGVGSLFRGEELGYLAKLILTYADGTTETVVTDETWKSANASPVQKGTGIYAGERYDARVDLSWMLPGYNDGTWRSARRNTEFTGSVTAWYGATVTVRKDLERLPQSITVYAGADGATSDSYGTIHVVGTYADGDVITLEPGQTLLTDFGQNSAGWEYFEIEGERGTVVTVEHGEWLNDRNGEKSRGNDGPGGSLYNKNYRTATANTIYTMRGGEVECYHPSLTFYGFQYIEITATKTIRVHKLRGQVVTSVHKDTGTFETGIADVDRLVSNIRWGMYSNYLSVPTDCPQRNERHGWMGDTQVFSHAGMYLSDAKSFLMKYAQDIRDAQRESDGAYSDISPYVNAYGTVTYGDVGWEDAGIIIPWYLYMMYGDKSIILDGWDSMNRFMDGFMANTNGLGSPIGQCDHLNLADNTKKDRPLIAIAFYAWDALMMRDMAQAIGDEASVAKYQAQYEAEKALFQSMFVREDGTLSIGSFTLSDGTTKDVTQTACLFALYLDLLPDANSVHAVTEQLTQDLAANGNLMQTGFLGTAIISKTLTKIGRSDLAYILLRQTKYPSWLYSVKQGATTIWERWNTYTKETGFGDVSMNSFNHYSYGAVAGWMFQTAAGIGYDPENPGFKNILLAPEPSGLLPNVTASYDSAYGEIAVQSQLKGNDWTYTATVPANATATVILPVSGEVTVNGKALSALTKEEDGIVCLGRENAAVRFEADAGTFTFRSSVALIGDINGDGAVSGMDITVLRRHLAGGWGADVVRANSDANSDGVIGVQDVLTLRRYLVGGYGVELGKRSIDDNSTPLIPAP